MIVRNNLITNDLSERESARGAEQGGVLRHSIVRRPKGPRVKVTRWHTAVAFGGSPLRA